MSDPIPLSWQLKGGAPTVSPLALPNLNSLTAAAVRIANRWPTTVPTPREKDKEALVQLMLARLDTGRWEGTKLSIVLQAASALFDPERRDRPDLEDLRWFYYAEIVASDRSSFLSGMADVYLTSFDSTARHTRALARALVEVWPRMNARWRSLANECPEIFEPERASKALASCMLQMENPYIGLRQIGMRTPHAPGLMDHAHEDFIRLISDDLASPEAVESLFAWLCPPSREARRSGAGMAISAMLRPWLNRQPDEDFRTHLVERLTALYGDPRLSSGGIWSGVEAQELQVLLRWLTGENIRFFLDVVSEVETSHMWAPRRRFWLALYEQGRIDGAWVAFSRAAATLARSKSTSAEKSIRYGLQTARGSRLRTSLLILSIGKKIVVEGSHNYKVHVFRDTIQDAPRLYQKHYDAERIRLRYDADARAHFSGWEGWILERI